MVLTKKEVGELIKKARKDKSRREGRKYTQEMLARDLGVSRSYVGDLETGRSYPNYELLNKIANACNVPLDFFSDVERTYHELISKHLQEYPSEVHEAVVDGLKQNGMNVDFLGNESNSIQVIGYSKIDIPYQDAYKIPVVGTIRAGEPILAQENIIGHEFIPEEIAKSGEYFGLKVAGDSMNLSRIYDGDIVIARKQPVVENGEIAVVLVNKEEATIKKFYKTDNLVVLAPNSTNPAHTPKQFDITKTEVTVIGKVVRLIIDL